MYNPYLLISKKRYAGLLWTKPDKWDKIDTKGIETVRRDNCLLVRTHTLLPILPAGGLGQTLELAAWHSTFLPPAAGLLAFCPCPPPRHVFSSPLPVQVRNVVTTCLEKILVERAPGEACEYVKTVISDLLMNKLDLSLLVISKVGGWVGGWMWGQRMLRD